jgi:acetyl esterase/lipase
MAKTCKIILIFFFFQTSVAGAELQFHRDLAYAADDPKQQTLDIYSPRDAKDLPVVVWIHGGGWMQGDKSAVQQKPRAFAEHGFVFTSINYRFVPTVDVKTQAADVAKAIRWVRDHAAQYGGSAERLIIAGHSAGAHLAALVCTDRRFLEAQNVGWESVKACIPVDTAVYDARRQIQEVGLLRSQNYARVFGDADSQRDLSPLTHVESGKRYPPFLILHVADRPDSTAQSKQFAKALQAAGGTAKLVAAEDKTHLTINRDLGRANDPPTIAVFQFLKETIN